MLRDLRLSLIRPSGGLRLSTQQREKKHGKIMNTPRVNLELHMARGCAVNDNNSNNNGLLTEDPYKNIAPSSVAN